MKKQFELLAPGGDLDSIKAAIVAGADAVYCGLDSFNARNRAVNLSFDELTGVIKLAHKNDCQIFLTLNIIILENEIAALIKLLNKLVNSKIDGLIVQDMGLFYILFNYFKSIDVHASTQVTTHNEGQISFLNKLGVSRVNLSRELNIKEIKSLTSFGHRYNILSEVFVHGSYCVAFSGLCYISSAMSGNSGNRGRCSQPCRDQYQTTQTGNDYPLNMKDNSAFSDLGLLVDAGVDSFKIEGRIKGPNYVYTVVNSWYKQLQKQIQGKPLLDKDENLYKVFNRDFTDGYLQGDINQSMFIDNPRDNTLKHIEEKYQGSNPEQIEQAKQALYNEKIEMQESVQNKFKGFSISKTPLIITVTGQENSLLEVTVSMPEKDIVVQSVSFLRKAEQATIDRSALEKRFKSLNNAEYIIENLDLDNLQASLCIPFKELTAIKNRIVFLLNDGVELTVPVVVPLVKKQLVAKNKTQLAILIASEKDLSLCSSTSADIYYKLPDSFKKGCTKLINLFLNNQRLIPWFPAVLIGDDYHSAVELLKQLQPELIVTNNTGIAHQAYLMGINWIAGPYLNISNSFSLLSMQETSNCNGAFVSNELNKNQIKNIGRPSDFKLYYSIYHPLLLMKSRQCFFQQTVGCKKTAIDKNCMQRCNKSTSIINLKGDSFIIDKQKGGYPCLYNDKHFLNTEIIADLPGFFDGLFIDLSDIGAVEKITLDKEYLIKVFEDLVAGKVDAQNKINEIVGSSTNSQYKKGL